MDRNKRRVNYVTGATRSMGAYGMSDKKKKKKTGLSANWRMLIGVALSALLFAVLHGNLVQGVYAFVLGVYFAWLMERYGSIKVPILGHMSANFFITLISCSVFIR